MAHCQDYFHHLSLDSSGVSLAPSVVQILQDYYTEASKFSMDNFSGLNDMVASLDSPQQLQQWNSVWHKCQQTKQQLEETLARATAAESSAADAGSAPAESEAAPTEQPAANPCVLLPGALTPLPFEDSKPHSAEPFSKSPTSSISSSSHFIFPSDCDGKLRQSPSTFDDTDSDCTVDSSVSCHSEPVYSGAARLRKQPMKKIMKKTMSYELSPRDSGHSDVSHIHGYTGVYIKGLEVANNVSAEKKLQRPDVTSPALGRSRSMSTPTRAQRRSDGEGKKQSRLEPLQTPNWSITVAECCTCYTVPCSRTFMIWNHLMG